jgi:CubicO group peptidase (beta-lactamase class C family)
MRQMKLMFILCIITVLYTYSYVNAAYTYDWNRVDAAIKASPFVNSHLQIGNKNILHSTSKGSVITDTTPIFVTGASKFITSTIINRLVQNKIMSLDDNPQKYLTWWVPNETILETDWRFTITLGQLLSMTSGYGPDNDCVGSSTYTHVSCAQQIFNEDPIYYTPGSTFYYSSNNHEIASLMAVEASRKTDWAQIVTTFFASIGIQSTVLGSIVYTPPSNPNTAAGLTISPINYATFLQSYFTNTVVDVATSDQMETDWTATAAFVYSPINNGTSLHQMWHYGLGLWLQCRLESWYTPTCESLRQYSSPGLFGTVPLIDRDNKYWALLSIEDVIDSPTFVDAVSLMESLQPLIVSVLNDPIPSSVDSMEDCNVSVKNIVHYYTQYYLGRLSRHFDRLFNDKSEL